MVMIKDLQTMLAERPVTLPRHDVVRWQDRKCQALVASATGVGDRRGCTERGVRVADLDDP